MLPQFFQVVLIILAPGSSKNYYAQKIGALRRYFEPLNNQSPGEEKVAVIEMSEIVLLAGTRTIKEAFYSSAESTTSTAAEQQTQRLIAAFQKSRGQVIGVGRH